MKGLTQRQLQILGFIQEYIYTHKYSPSYREIMKHFGFSSLASVSRHVQVLKRKGALTSEDSCGRSLAPTTTPLSDPMVKLPYIGFITANNPIETFPQSQALSVPSFLIPDPNTTYALRARGNSLHDELIADGDLLLVNTNTDPNDGDTIIGSTPEHPTLVKKFHPEGTYVRLCSHSLLSAPLVLRHEDLMIHATLLSILRFYT